MKYPDSRILVFAKAPVPGTVKTRLEPLLGADGAASLHSSLVVTCLDMLSRSRLCPVELWCTPDSSDPFFQQCQQRFQVPLMQQSSGDLGDRMAGALDSALAESGAVVLVGTDCPGMTISDLDEALEMLACDKQVVLGPALDGGYYLVGMRRPQPFIFSQIPWSTPDVFNITRDRLDKAGISWHSLPVRRDLDRPEDFHAYNETDGLPGSPTTRVTKRAGAELLS